LKVKSKQSKRNPVIDNISTDNEDFATVTVLRREKKIKRGRLRKE